MPEHLGKLIPLQKAGIFLQIQLEHTLFMPVSKILQEIQAPILPIVSISSLHPEVEVVVEDEVEVADEAQPQTAVHPEISQGISTTISVQHQQMEQEVQTLELLPQEP